MQSDGPPHSADTDSAILAWYRDTGGAEAIRVRVSVEGRTLRMDTLSDRLLARRSLDRLENRAIPVIGETWSIGDSELPAPVLDLENERDYRTIQGASPKLLPHRVRWWRLLGFSLIESGGGTVLLLVLGSLGLYWLWQNLPFRQCIATHPDGILFLKCLIIDYFMRS